MFRKSLKKSVHPDGLTQAIPKKLVDSISASPSLMEMLNFFDKIFFLKNLLKSPSIPGLTQAKSKKLMVSVYIIGGDGTQKGAAVILEEIRRRGLNVAVAGILKTIDHDIPVIDKSFGFDTAVEEAQRAINAAHGIGLVKLVGRYSESPFYLEGPGGLFEYIAKRLKENGHMVIVIAEGAGQELLSESLRSTNQQDASGNKLLRDGGLWKQPVLECCGERDAVKRKFSFIHSCLFCCCSWLP